MNIVSVYIRSDFSPIDGSHVSDFARIESDPIDARAKCCIIRDLSGLRIQVSYAFHQSAGSTTNRAFKAPYTSHQSCNRILIRLLFHVCRHSLLDFIYPVSSQIAQVSICFAIKCCRVRFCIERRCNCGFISFITQLTLQCGDISFIRSDVRCILNNLGRICFGAKCCFIRFVVQQCIHSRLGIYLNGARRRRHIHLHVNFRTRYAQSSAEERKRHKRREKGTSSHPPNFSRACSRLRVRASDFRRYHIAILCLGPDDFVDVIHDDFPLCEKQ